MINEVAVTMTFTDFTITNSPSCTDISFYYEAFAYTAPSTYSALPSFITFDRLTKTFTVQSTNAADIGTH